MSYDEIRTLLQMINIDLSDQYARSLFQVVEHISALYLGIQSVIVIYTDQPQH